MLASLGVNLMILLILCTVLLLICWASDTLKHAVEAEGRRAVQSQVTVHPHSSWSPVGRPASTLCKVWGLDHKAPSRKRTPETAGGHDGARLWPLGS
jgi:hypothetical protein